ncbi:hypothetical protein H0E87_003160 [Populus deltoides]|uniref:DUF2828 domain-containing protein n=1 Tax=Populus deltoides TaxID=3696 RepID=A0A8T2ZYK1_POPDE|nr:hypothetical protein H0E87_003160 [Populus deltoides]
MLGLAFPDIPKSRIRREGQRWKKENARIAKKERRGAIAKKVVDIYSHDLDYRFLYEGVLYFFAVFLKTDMQHLNYRLTRKINLAAKWCPSTDSSFDRSTMLSENCK